MQRKLRCICQNTVPPQTEAMACTGSFVTVPCVLLNTKWLLLRTRKETWKGDRKLCWIFFSSPHLYCRKALQQSGENISIHTHTHTQYTIPVHYTKGSSQGSKLQSATRAVISKSVPPQLTSLLHDAPNLVVLSAVSIKYSSSTAMFIPATNSVEMQVEQETLYEMLH